MENQQIPTTTEWFWNALEICQIDGFWYTVTNTDSMEAFRSGFEPRNDDVLLTSFPKTGTTWLKALCHNILNLDQEEEDDILAKKNPHEVVPTLEHNFLQDQVQNMLLNASSGCKIVYVARNLKDTVVSMWHFRNEIFKIRNAAATADDDDDDDDGYGGLQSLLYPLGSVVESFCDGVMPYGPFYDHVAGYWKESQRRPEEVLFLKYEELCRDPREQVRKLAEFLGKPFGEGGGGGGDGDGEVEKVVGLSSLKRLKELEVNKNGVWELVYSYQLPKRVFFRKGIVGDWKNCLTSDMAQRIDQLTRVKLQGTGLCFDDRE